MKNKKTITKLGYLLSGIFTFCIATSCSYIQDRFDNLFPSSSSKESSSNNDSPSSSSSDVSSSLSESSSQDEMSSESSLSENVSSSEDSQEKEPLFDSLDFYFISAGKSGTLYNGDSIYIKAGETDILIDAGPKAWSSQSIINEVNKYCTDNKLEYVIATHAHADHIPGFYGTNANGIFYNYDIGTIIDFPVTQSKTATYSNYLKGRDYAVSKGATHYSALDCWNETDGAKKVYTLGNGLSMEILYQRYYEEIASGENDYSVSLLFRQGEKKMLFTGDLEEDGIESLLRENEIGEVDLYKGGHHGSINANPVSLFEVIKPKTICTCCVAGSNEYTANLSNTMPYQKTIDNWAKWTDDVYVTNYAIPTGKKQDIGSNCGELNGTINVKYDVYGDKHISGSNNSLKLKDTEWMKTYRVMPTNWK